MTKLMPILASILLLNGCVPDDGRAWESRLGIGMMRYDIPDYMTPEQVDEQALAVIGGLESIGWSRPKMLDCMYYVRVWVKAAPFQCSSASPEMCNGVQKVGSLYIAAKPCRYHTALMHEMVHFLQACAEDGYYDPNHEQTEVWQAGDVFIRECTPDELKVIAP